MTVAASLVVLMLNNGSALTNVTTEWRLSM